MHHDFIQSLGSVSAVSLAPIVADGISKNVSIPVERRRGDGSSNERVALETVLGVLIPEVERAVAAGGAERAVLRVEGNRVQCEDVADITIGARCLAMAFEAEIRTLVLLLDVLDRAAAFDTTDSETGRVCEAADRSRLPL